MNDIHIRYEDSLTIPGHVFAVGMTMESLSAQSTDDEWVSICLFISLCVVRDFNFLCQNYNSWYKWTLSVMTSKNKNGGDSWGTLHGKAYGEVDVLL